MSSPRREEIGCCAPGFVAAMVILAVFACGVAFLTWTLLAWLGGMR